MWRRFDRSKEGREGEIERLGVPIERGKDYRIRELEGEKEAGGGWGYS